MRIGCLLLMLVSGMSQATVAFTEKTTVYKKSAGNTSPIPMDDIAMPYFESSNTRAAAAINDQLFIGQFESLAPRRYQPTFTESDGVIVEGTASQSYEISRNDDRVLTVDFDIEGCGAYCESYRTYYSFHAPTGRLLTDEDLFTNAGMEQMAKIMRKERILRYQQQIASSKKELALERKKKASPQLKENMDDIDARIELNETCLSELLQPVEPSYAATLLEQFHYLDVRITNKGIDLTAGRCSNHAMRALDDVADVEKSLPFSAIKPYLTAYGKAVLLNEGTVKAPSSIYGALLRGKLGANIGVSMQLQKNADGTIAGKYFYDKFRKAIRLTGQQTGNTLVLTEQHDDDSLPVAEISLAIQGGRLKGKWKGAKQFDIELTVP